ncbi:hypothetical protein Tco_0396886 [Tanacetum coccineum]
MASGGNDRDAKDALSKLLQMGTVPEYQNEFVMLINRVTRISESLLKSFYISGLKVALQIELLRVRPTTLAEAFSLARITEVRFEDERSTVVIAKPNNLNTGEKDDAKPPIFADTFGSNGGDDSETSGPKTPAKEVVDNMGGAHNFAQPNAGTGSEVVPALSEEFPEGDMVDALSRVVQQKSSRN